MTNEHNDLQKKLTKESIFTALMDLMQKKSFSKISITELTKKAGVSRMAFYRNYSIIEDVMINHLNDILSEYSEHIKNKPQTHNFEAMRIFFSFLRTHKLFMIYLINSNLDNLIFKSCSAHLRTIINYDLCTKPYKPEMESYNIAFIVGGFYHVLIEWCKNDMKETDDEMADMIYKRLF